MVATRKRIWHAEMAPWNVYPACICYAIRGAYYGRMRLPPIANAVSAVVYYAREGGAHFIVHCAFHSLMSSVLPVTLMREQHRALQNTCIVRTRQAAQRGAWTDRVRGQYMIFVHGSCYARRLTHDMQTIDVHYVVVATLSGSASAMTTTEMDTGAGLR